MDAILPYLLADDVRQEELANRVSQIASVRLADDEKFSLFGVSIMAFCSYLYCLFLVIYIFINILLYIAYFI